MSNYMMSGEAEIYYPAKTKTKLNPKQIMTIIIMSIVFALVAGVGGFAFWFLFGGKAIDVGVLENVNLEVDMNNTYYVGTDGDVNLKMAFPGQTVKLKDENGPASINGDVLKVNGGDGETFILLVDGTEVTTTIVEAVNVSDYEEMYSTIVFGELAVCVHADELKMTKESPGDTPTLILKNSFYGNGVRLDAHEVVVSSDDGKNWWGNGGETAMSVETNKEIVIRDLHLFGKTHKEGDTIKSYTNYGNLLSIGTVESSQSSDNKFGKANVTLERSIIEKGAKNVHINNANVDINNCVVKEASDTAISVGTAAYSASVINIKDSVIANSMAGGIVIYCFDRAMSSDAQGAQEGWNTINIEGGLDIYNWKDEKKLVFIPDTEMAALPSSFVGQINGIVTGEMSKPEHADKKVVVDGTGYIHFAIVKIFTAGKGGPSNGQNLSKVNGFENIGYKEEVMPFPPAFEGIISMIMQQAVICGYYNNAEGSVKVGDTLDQSTLLPGYFKVVEGSQTPAV